jgi:hypothetical protein
MDMIQPRRRMILRVSYYTGLLVALVGTIAAANELLGLEERGAAAVRWAGAFLASYAAVVLLLAYPALLWLSHRLDTLSFGWLAVAPGLAVGPLAIDYLGSLLLEKLVPSLVSPFSALRDFLQVPGVVLLRICGRSGMLVHPHFPLRYELVQHVLFVPLNVVGWIVVVLSVAWLGRNAARVLRRPSTRRGSTDL